MKPGYEQAMEFWLGCINYEQRVPQPDDLKLDRMRALLARLGDPQQRLRILHIAGSKGKGSTAAMLAADLREAGYRAGLFTSPHLWRGYGRIAEPQPSRSGRSSQPSAGNVSRPWCSSVSISVIATSRVKSPPKEAQRIFIDARALRL